MKYILKRHSVDSSMIEATQNTYESTYLAFVIHEDMIEDMDLMEALDTYGEIEVEMKLIRRRTNGTH